MITIISHGFKFSRPEANFVMDVSFFKNPWRDEEIKNEKDEFKRKQLIMKFMKDQEGLELFVDRVSSLLRLLYLIHPNENMVVAFCCSAGEYRSPAIAEMVGEVLGSDVAKVIKGDNSKI